MKLHKMRYTDDCLRCVIATQLGINYGDTPRVHADRHLYEDFWSRWGRWAAKRGLRWRCKWGLVGTVPAPPVEGLWAALVPAGNQSHALLYEGRRFVYDPDTRFTIRQHHLSKLRGYNVLEPIPAGAAAGGGQTGTWLAVSFDYEYVLEPATGWVRT